MFGFGKARAALSSTPRVAPRDEALDAVRVALEAAACVLTAALREVGIDPQHLAEDAPIPPLPVAITMERALRFVDDGQMVSLRLGKTDDFSTYDLEPHYRYLEIHMVVDELERLGRDRAERRSELVRQHGPHALLQARMLSYFVLRAATVEQMQRADDDDGIKRELQFSAEAIGNLSASLSAPFARHIDVPAVRAEWLRWPQIMVERDLA